MKNEHLNAGPEPEQQGPAPCTPLAHPASLRIGAKRLGSSAEGLLRSAMSRGPPTRYISTRYTYLCISPPSRRGKKEEKAMGANRAGRLALYAGLGGAGGAPGLTAPARPASAPFGIPMTCSSLNRLVRTSSALLDRGELSF